jgi:hypothetical protein
MRTPGFKAWWSNWDDNTVAPEFAAVLRAEIGAIDREKGEGSIK